MKRLTYIEFSEKAEQVHKGLYEYPEQIFKNTKTKIKIFCKRGNHFFEQLPSIHLLGKGCKNCSLRKTKEEFLKEAGKKYKSRFKYNLENYKKSTDKIKILCNNCKNETIQQANSHLLAKNGCPYCAKTQAKNNIRKSFESFIEKSIQRNGDIFKIEIIETPFDRKSKLKIKCKFCDNIFYSYANNILNKVGCPSCSHNSKHPDTEGFVYQLLYDEKEIPYIGITTCSLKVRLLRHKEAIKYKKNNTKLFNFLKNKNLSLLGIKEIDKGKAFQLAEKEDYWINKLNTQFPKGLNKNKGGSGLNLKYEKRTNTEVN